MKTCKGGAALNAFKKVFINMEIKMILTLYRGEYLYNKRKRQLKINIKINSFL